MATFIFDTYSGRGKVNDFGRKSLSGRVIVFGGRFFLVGELCVVGEI